MIKKFNQYNESIRDEMTPKSENELKTARENLLKELDDVEKSQTMSSETFIYYLRLIFDSDKEIINALIDNGMEAADLLVSLTMDLDANKSERDYEMIIMNDLIKKNIDKIDFSKMI